MSRACGELDELGLARREVDHRPIEAVDRDRRRALAGGLQLVAARRRAPRAVLASFVRERRRRVGRGLGRIAGRAETGQRRG
ncbi:MAG TPA: hypothetical protein VGF63_11240, partial [Solirubrobacteraceae bacterium]